jgi:hypothetical protein
VPVLYDLFLLLLLLLLLLSANNMMPTRAAIDTN